MYSNWSQSKGVACATLKFEEFGVIPPSVPRQREDEWKGTFVPPLRTFFTVAENHDFQKSGGATIAAGGLDIYTQTNGIPGWAVSILQTGMTMGRVYRVKMSADGRSAVGANEELFERPTAIETSRSAATSGRFIW